MSLLPFSLKIVKSNQQLTLNMFHKQKLHFKTIINPIQTILNPYQFKSIPHSLILINKKHRFYKSHKLLLTTLCFTSHKIIDSKYYQIDSMTLIRIFSANLSTSKYKMMYKNIKIFKHKI